MKYLIILFSVLILSCSDDDTTYKQAGHIIGGLQGTLIKSEEIHNDVCKYEFNNSSICNFRILADCNFFTSVDTLILTECAQDALFNVFYTLNLRWFRDGTTEHHYKQVTDNYNGVYNLDVCFTYPDNVLIFEDVKHFKDTLYLTTKK